MQPRLSRSHQGYHAEDFRSLLMLGAYVQLLVIHHYPESPLSVWPCKFDISWVHALRTDRVAPLRRDPRLQSTRPPKCRPEL